MKKTEGDNRLAQLALPLIEFWRCVEEVITGLRKSGGAAAFDDATLFLRAFVMGSSHGCGLTRHWPAGRFLMRICGMGLHMRVAFSSRANYRRRAAGSR